MRVLIFSFFFVFYASGQQGEVLVIGNHERVCFGHSQLIELSDSLPDSLDKYGAILLFSNASSQLNKTHLNRLVSFVEDGGGLYTGAENWPMQAESNQITEHLFKKESYGNYTENSAEVSSTEGNLDLHELESIPTGVTAVAFPLDYRLHVEAWVGDQALILSGDVGEGRIIIDGGYSRFYCEQRTSLTDVLLYKILMYLLGD